MSTPSKVFCQHVRDHLRDDSLLALRNEYCDNRTDGKPPAVAGQYFVSIFPTSMSEETDQNHGEDISLGFGIGITQRTGYCPDDRMYREAAEKAPHGALVLCQRIRRVIRRDRHQLICEATASLDGTEWSNGQYVEPPQMAGASLQLRQVGPKHWGKSPVKNPQGCKDYGVYVELRYSGVRFMESFWPDANSSGPILIIVD